MRTALLAAFDLMVNAIGSFWIATIVVGLALAALRVQPGLAARTLWAIPFFKVAWDTAHGIPANAFFWARIEGTKQTLGSFFAGFGIHYVVPTVHLTLASHTDRGRMPSTIADLFASFLAKRVSPHAPVVIALVLIFVAIVKVTVRVARVVLGERARAQLVCDAIHLGDRRVGRRVVPVFVSRDHEGAPFTGGLLDAYVCVPLATFEALSEPEREAVIAHELAHVARRDLAIATALDLACDVLWFVPLVGFVRRRIDASTERLADEEAVSKGASPIDLASALVRVGQSMAAPSSFASALVRPRSGLAARVAALLGKAPSPRLGIERPWIALLWAAWLAAIVLSSSLAGHV